MHEKEAAFVSRLFQIDLCGKAVPLARLPRPPNQNCCSPGYQFRPAAATFRLVDALLKCKQRAKLLISNVDLSALLKL
jgi:hypothetical protein